MAYVCLRVLLYVLLSMYIMTVGYRNPGEFGIDYEDLMIPGADGVRVHAWLMKQPSHSTRPTIIFFHGNAGSTVCIYINARYCRCIL